MLREHGTGILHVLPALTDEILILKVLKKQGCHEVSECGTDMFDFEFLSHFLLVFRFLTAITV